MSDLENSEVELLAINQSAKNSDSLRHNTTRIQGQSQNYQSTAAMVCYRQIFGRQEKLLLDGT